MFQRIKGAIDRTIAEEQARQKTYLSDQATASQARQPSAVSRSNSGASTAGKRPRQKKAAQDASKEADAAANPDPAVFEAAFVIDDDEPSRTATPLPPSEEKNGETQEKEGGAEGENVDTSSGNTGKDLEKTAEDDSHKPTGGKPLSSSKPTTAAASPELPPDVRAKLRKLEKLEATYPG